MFSDAFEPGGPFYKDRCEQVIGWLKADGYTIIPPQEQQSIEYKRKLSDEEIKEFRKVWFDSIEKTPVFFINQKSEIILKFLEWAENNPEQVAYYSAARESVGIWEPEEILIEYNKYIPKPVKVDTRRDKLVKTVASVIVWFKKLQKK